MQVEVAGDRSQQPLTIRSIIASGHHIFMKYLVYDSDLEEIWYLVKLDM